ncbi:MAG TPA: hypothetical protein PLF21_05885 [Exilispira sp.]|nr:hypothetical protein [Exilispira sp.]
MVKEELLKKIISLSFWDYDIDEKYLENAIKNGPLIEKIKIAKKIIFNMLDPVDSLLFFSKQDLLKIFENLDEKSKKSEKVLLLENCLLGKNNKISKYEWKKF